MNLTKDLNTIADKYPNTGFGAEMAEIAGLCRAAANRIESLQAQLAASQAKERAAVEAIRKSLRVEKQQRPNLNRCHECAKRIVDSGQRKYKYGCESLCPEALKVIVGCGFDVYEPLIPFADEWRGPRQGGETE